MRIQNLSYSNYGPVKLLYNSFRYFNLWISLDTTKTSVFQQLRRFKKYIESEGAADSIVIALSQLNCSRKSRYIMDCQAAGTIASRDWLCFYLQPADEHSLPVGLWRKNHWYTPTKFSAASSGYHMLLDFRKFSKRPVPIKYFGSSKTWSDDFDIWLRLSFLFEWSILTALDNLATPKRIKISRNNNKDKTS